MDPLGLMILVLLLVFIIELFRHFLFRSHLLILHMVTKLVLVMVIVGVIFLLMISQLKSEGALNTDNKLVKTGAAIVEKIEDKEFIYNTKEALSDLKEEIMQTFKK
jgi:hypothetical protein